MTPEASPVTDASAAGRKRTASRSAGLYPITCSNLKFKDADPASDNRQGEPADLQRFAGHVLLCQILEGSGMLLTPAEKIRLPKHSLTLIPAGIRFDLRPVTDGECRIISFDPDALRLKGSDEAQRRTFNTLTGGGSGISGPVRLDHPENAALRSTLEFVGEFASYRDAGMRLQIKGCLLQILGMLFSADLLHKKSVRKRRRRVRKDERIREIFTYIQSNYRKPLSVTELAGMLNVSRQYFSRFFKSATDCTFIEYLNDLRLHHAAREILLSDEEITDIAPRHGFDSISHFYRLFNRRYGCTPLRYRMCGGATESAGSPGRERKSGS